MKEHNTTKQAIIITLGLMVMVVFVLVWVFTTLPDEPDKNTFEDAYSINANTLIKEFDSNEVKAKDDYMKSWLLVDGELANILGGKNKAQLYMRSDALFDFESVVCFVEGSEEIEKVKSLSVGDPISVKGKLIRKLLGEYELRQCTIQ